MSLWTVSNGVFVNIKLSVTIDVVCEMTDKVADISVNDQNWIVLTCDYILKRIWSIWPKQFRAAKQSVLAHEHSGILSLLHTALSPNVLANYGI